MLRISTKIPEIQLFCTPFFVQVRQINCKIHNNLLMNFHQQNSAFAPVNYQFYPHSYYPTLQTQYFVPDNQLLSNFTYFNFPTYPLNMFNPSSFTFNQGIQTQFSPVLKICEQSNNLESTVSDSKKPNELTKKKKYLKKNTESNIANQAFSFLISRSKSQYVLRKILQKMNLYNMDRIITFYHNIKVVKKYARKYFNKKELLNMCKYDHTHPAYKEINRQHKKCEALDSVLFARLIRILIIHFLEEECTSNILCSRKIDRDTVLEHLERKTQIKDYLLMEMSRM